jgi:hypothetical protein
MSTSAGCHSASASAAADCACSRRSPARAGCVQKRRSIGRRRALCGAGRAISWMASLPGATSTRARRQPMTATHAPLTTVDIGNAGRFVQQLCVDAIRRVRAPVPVIRLRVCRTTPSRCSLLASSVTTGIGPARSCRGSTSPPGRSAKGWHTAWASRWSGNPGSRPPTGTGALRRQRAGGRLDLGGAGQSRLPTRAVRPCSKPAFRASSQPVTSARGRESAAPARPSGVTSRSVSVDGRDATRPRRQLRDSVTHVRFPGPRRRRRRSGRRRVPGFLPRGSPRRPARWGRCLPGRCARRA